MSRRVVCTYGGIAAPANHLSLVHHHGTNRHLAVGQGQSGLSEGFLHEAFIGLS